jgi:hypothetical protein
MIYTTGIIKFRHKKCIFQLNLIVFDVAAVPFLSSPSGEVFGSSNLETFYLFALLSGSNFLKSCINFWSVRPRDEALNECRRWFGSGKVTAIHGHALRFQEVEASRFHDNRHVHAVRLSALRTERL